MSQLPGGVLCRTVGGSLNVGPLYSTWTDVITIPHFNASPDISSTSSSTLGDNFIVQAFTQIASNVVPSVGHAHPTVPHCYCTGVRGDPLQGDRGPSPVGLKFFADWITPTAYTSGAPIGMQQAYPRHEISVEPYQLQEVRNFDRGRRRTSVLYAIPNLNLTMYFPPYRIADIRVPRTMHCITITQYEDVSNNSAATLCKSSASASPGSDSVPKQPFFNSDQWYGFPPAWALWIGTSTHNNGIPLARRSYKYLINDRGWNKFIAVYTQQNGYVPRELPEMSTDNFNPAFAPTPGTQAQNGIGVFNMLDEAEFSQAFPLIYTSLAE